MFGKDSKPLYFFIIIFNKPYLSVPYNTPVADIIFADIFGSDNFSLDIGFESDSGVPVNNVNFLSFSGTVKIYLVVYTFWWR